MSSIDLVIGLLVSIGKSLTDAAQDLEELKRQLRERPEFNSDATDEEWRKTEEALK